MQLQSGIAAQPFSPQPPWAGGLQSAIAAAGGAGPWVGHWSAGGRVQAGSTTRHAREGGEGVCARARLRRRWSRGEANTPTYLPPPPATAPCWHAFGGGRVFWPQVRHASPTAARPFAAATARPARARDWARADHPPDAAPSSMRLLVALIYAVYQFTSSSCSVPRNTPLAGPPSHPCATPRSHGSLPRAALGRCRAPCSELCLHFVPTLCKTSSGTHAHAPARAPHSSGAPRCSPRELTPKLRAGRFLSLRGERVVLATPAPKRRLQGIDIHTRNR